MKSANSSSIRWAHQRLQIGMLFGKLQRLYLLCVSDNKGQGNRALQARTSSGSRQKGTDFWIATAGEFVDPGLYVNISDVRRGQSPSLAQNTSNATTVLPVNSSTLGEFGEAVLSGLSETSSLASTTPTGVGKPLLALPLSAPTIPSS